MTTTTDRFVWEPGDLVWESKDADRKSEPTPHILEVLRGGTVRKVDAEQRLVTGWFSVITNSDGSPHVDSQGDVIDEDMLVKTAHNFMTNYRDAGEVHMKGADGEPRVVGTVVESLVVTKGVKKTLGLPPDTPTGWMGTVYVRDDGVWSKVKSGEYQGFSIGGVATREPIFDLTKDDPGLVDTHTPGIEWSPTRSRVKRNWWGKLRDRLNRVVKEWNESQHPRVLSGEGGGRFADAPTVGEEKAEVIAALFKKYETPEILKIQQDEEGYFKSHTITAHIDTEERHAMRAGWVDDEWAKQTQGGVRNQRILDLVLGGPGTGKSTQVANPLIALRSAVLVDPDEFKDRIPENDGGRGSAIVHEESSMLAGSIMDRALHQGANVVAPMTGKTASKIEQLIKAARNRGYRVFVHEVHVPLETAVQRTISRWKKAPTGRFVSPQYTLVTVDSKPAATFQKVKEMAHGYVRYDNSGTHPVVVEENTLSSRQWRPFRSRGSGGHSGGSGIKAYLYRFARKSVRIH
jgi:predicted ABC-type ATPase